MPRRACGARGAYGPVRLAGLQRAREGVVPRQLQGQGQQGARLHEDAPGRGGRLLRVVQRARPAAGACARGCAGLRGWAQCVRACAHTGRGAGGGAASGGAREAAAAGAGPRLFAAARCASAAAARRAHAAPRANRAHAARRGAARAALAASGVVYGEEQAGEPAAASEHLQLLKPAVEDLAQLEVQAQLFFLNMPALARRP